MALLISAAQRRFLVVASTFFFLFSVFICISRLVGLTFESVDVKHEILSKINYDKADLPMSYGAYHRPGYDSITLTRALPKEYIPTKENGRRLIVIGDIHGMLEPLNELLKKSQFDPEKDHVISVGDMINKGPDSAKVVERLMELNATAVRGNHEDRVLVAWSGLNEQEGVGAYLDSDHEALRRGKDKDLATARTLSGSQIEWLMNLPVVITIEPLSLFIVHAGLVPGLTISNQDPWAMMNMRSLRFPRGDYRTKEEEIKQKQIEAQKKKEQDMMERLEHKGRSYEKRWDKRTEESTPVPTADSDDSSNDNEANDEYSQDDPLAEIMAHFDREVWLPVDNREGEPWTDIWNYFQRKMDPSLRQTVIYGHDAKLGYQEQEYSYGIDSGCVKGHALTALIISIGDSETSFDRTTIQAICKDPKSKSWW
ncbi:Metallo-dependent phosphatase-like protein [Mariannaea sp. PMI_226]|nr:Metallo-dependent phosphatase-like protein [Mariannaea sp. PMI_226]